MMYEEELRRLVVGGIALSLHGYPQSTLDLDLLPSLEPDNLKTMVRVLLDLGFSARPPVDPMELADPEKRRYWRDAKNLRAFSFFDPHKMERTVDLLIYSPVSFAECAQRQHIVQMDSVPVALASLEDLLVMKRAAGRNKDLSDIKLLEELVRKTDA